MTARERVLLWAATAAAVVTGVAYAGVKYLLQTDDPFAVVHHPWQPYLLKAHILVTPILLFALGVVFGRHVLRQWRSDERDGRRSGAVTLAAVGLMAASGYLIQTVTSRAVVRWLVAAHLVAGAVFVLAAAGHQMRAIGRKRAVRRRRHALLARRAS